MAFRDRFENCALNLYTKGLAHQEAMREFLNGHEWTFFVTIAFNEATTKVSAHRLLRLFHQRLDKKMFGKNFYRRPETARTFFIALPEQASSLHFHALFRVPTEVRERFMVQSPSILKSVAKAASYDIQPIPTPSDQERIINYITKAAYKGASIETFIVSSEFSRRPVTFS